MKLELHLALKIVIFLMGFEPKLKAILWHFKRKYFIYYIFPITFYWTLVLVYCS